MMRLRITCTVSAALAVMLTLAACSGDGGQAELVEQHKMLAGELQSNKLYLAAVEEYEKILAFTTIDTSTRANVNYLIADICFRYLHDYEKAAACYIRARSLLPDGSFQAEASRNLVAALEKMGHLVDARRELSVTTDIDSRPADKDDVAVAQIGDEKIWLSEIDNQIQNLPPQVQEQMLDPGEKKKFVEQYVGLQLVYRAAVRENYDNDPVIMEKHRLFLRQLLIDKYLLDKVVPQVKVDSLDVFNFYQANKSSRYENKPYDSVRARVFVDYQSQKAEKAVLDYIADLAESERVRIFEENLR
ncbi:MAG: hypothetical protein JSW34_01870 [Candidatus Zixiibacteriota bacterium]|nr:MAG: hypothetical protein JSW34_01870 [candidate division Zixibacteria bacterium]